MSNKEIPAVTFKLNIEQLNIILKHLGEGKFVEVQPIIESLHNQVTPQLSVEPAKVNSNEVPDFTD